MEIKNRGEINYPIDEVMTSSCFKGQVFFKFEEKGRFRLKVEVINCCPGLSGGVVIQHPNDRKEPNPAGPGEQHTLEKGESYSTSFNASIGQQVHIFCRDIKREENTCVFKYTIAKEISA